MSRDGLVERNSVTGEEVRISQREQDFDLRKDSQTETGKSRQSHHQSKSNLQKTETQQDIDFRQDESLNQNLPTEQVTNAQEDINGYTLSSQQNYISTKPIAPSKIRSSRRLSRSDEASENSVDNVVTESTSQVGEGKSLNTNDVKAITESDIDILNVTGTVMPKSGRLQFSENDFSGNGKLSKLEIKSNKAGAKLEKARDKLPSKKRIQKKRIFDEKKGKAKTKFTIEKEIKPKGQKQPLPKRTIKSTAREVKNFGVNKIHEKIGEVENENVAVKAAHKTEQLAESAYHSRTVQSALQYVKDTRYRRVTKLENKYSQINRKLNYQKNVNDNPKLKSNALSRMAQCKFNIAYDFYYEQFFFMFNNAHKWNDCGFGIKLSCR